MDNAQPKSVNKTVKPPVGTEGFGTAGGVIKPVLLPGSRVPAFSKSDDSGTFFASGTAITIHRVVHIMRNCNILCSSRANLNPTGVQL